jgi:hypothetical protein
VAKATIVFDVWEAHFMMTRTQAILCSRCFLGPVCRLRASTRTAIPCPAHRGYGRLYPCQVVMLPMSGTFRELAWLRHGTMTLSFPEN